VNFEFVGWCNEDSHDKVWGVIVLKHGLKQWDIKTYATFWGRRGKKLQHKIFKGDQWDIDKAVRSKVNKGYNKINQHKLDEVYPEFQMDLEKTAIWAMLRA